MNDIFIAGDVVCRNRIISKVNLGQSIIISNEIQSIINNASYSVVNLECPVGDSSMFIKKAGPSLCCPAAFLITIKDAGFNGVTLANNHFYDCGEEGVKNTINTCDNIGLDFYGGGLNIEQAREVKTVHLQNDTFVDIVNVCENEFSIATESHGGANSLDIVEIYNAITRSLDKQHRVIVIVHGGHEYYQLPSPRMQKLYRFFIDIGASAVVNHHQHCFCGFEVYKDRPIFYGLGNFYFDYSSKNHLGLREYGFAVLLSFSKDIQFQIIPFVQCKEDAIIRDLSTEEKDFFDFTIDNLNAIIKDPIKLKRKWSDFALTNKIELSLSPFFNRLTYPLYRKKWFPAFVPLKQRYLQLNYIQCESHRDVLLYRLRHIIHNKK